MQPFTLDDFTIFITRNLLPRNAYFCIILDHNSQAFEIRLRLVFPKPLKIWRLEYWLPVVHLIMPAVLLLACSPFRLSLLSFDAEFVGIDALRRIRFLLLNWRRALLLQLRAFLLPDTHWGVPFILRYNLPSYSFFWRLHRLCNFFHLELLLLNIPFLFLRF